MSSISTGRKSLRRRKARTLILFERNLPDMTHVIQSYFSPKLEVKPIVEKGGGGVFARQPIPAGDIVMIWGGRIISGDQFDQAPPQNQHSIVQIGENFYTGTIAELEPVDYTNHSCNANVGMSGQIVLVAMRPIAVGEEACFDYAMTDGSPYDEFDCACG